MNHKLLFLLALVVVVAGCQAHDKHETQAEHAEHAEPAQEASAVVATTQPVARTVTDQTAELGCASCVYHTAGVSSCQPALKLDDQVLTLKGADEVLAPFGNMKLCSGALAAQVDGQVQGDAFIATAIRVTE